MGSLIETAAPSQARGEGWVAARQGAAIAVAKQRVFARVGGHVPLEHDRCRPTARGRLAEPLQSLQVFLLLRRGQPDDLERMISLEQTVGVVVDGLARPAEQPRGRIVLAEDQMGVGLAALQGDSHGHLANRAARERIGAGQRLGAEQHVDPESAALPHQPVHQQGGFLGQLVVLDEKLLELVDDQEHARQRLIGMRVAEGLDILDAAFAEQVASLPQFDVQTLQHTHAEFAFALDRHDPCVRQPQRRRTV